MDFPLRDRIAAELRHAGFRALTGGHMFPGEQPQNICNKGLAGKGVQLELPRGLRDELAAVAGTLDRFVRAVRTALVA